MKRLIIFLILFFDGGLYCTDSKSDENNKLSMLMLRFRSEEKRDCTVGNVLLVPARITEGYSKEKELSEDMKNSIRSFLSDSDKSLFDEWIRTGIKPLDVSYVKKAI